MTDEEEKFIVCYVFISAPIFDEYKIVNVTIEMILRITDFKSLNGKMVYCNTTIINKMAIFFAVLLRNPLLFQPVDELYISVHSVGSSE